MPEVLDREAAADVDATIQYEIEEPVHHVVDHGTVTIHEGRAEAPDLVVRVADDDLLKLFYGELNPLAAFMAGRVRVEGDVQLAQNLLKLVDRERLEDLAREHGAAPRLG